MYMILLRHRFSIQMANLIIAVLNYINTYSVVVIT